MSESNHLCLLRPPLPNRGEFLPSCFLTAFQIYFGRSCQVLPPELLRLYHPLCWMKNCFARGKKIRSIEELVQVCGHAVREDSEDKIGRSAICLYCSLLSCVCSFQQPPLSSTEAARLSIESCCFSETKVERSSQRRVGNMAGLGGQKS